MTTSRKPEARSSWGDESQEAAAAVAFPVKVEAILAFCDTPEGAFQRILLDAASDLDNDRAAQANEGVAYSFEFRGQRYDITITNTKPV